MTDDRMALVELLQNSGDGDFLRAVAEAVLQILMKADVEGLIGAGRHERSADRLNYRNGYRERSLDTRLGSLQLRIPKLRQGSAYDHCTAKYLAQARVKVTALRLGDRGIHGNGHMVMLEKNNLQVAGLIVGWLAHAIPAH